MVSAAKGLKKNGDVSFIMTSTVSMANQLEENYDELNFFMSTVLTALTLKPVFKIFPTL